jgi:plastocyanin
MRIREKRVAVILGAFLAAGTARAGEIKGKVSVPGASSAQNVAVYIDAIANKKFDAPAEHVSIDQRNMTFIPHVTLILRGTTVDFLNSDQVAHNVYWPSIGQNKHLHHSLLVVSPNQKKSFQFNDLGVAQTLCNFHTEMLGYVLILPTPYFAPTGSDGSYSIKNIPPGTYTLKVWSENGKASSQSVAVTDATTNVDLVVKK